MKEIIHVIKFRCLKGPPKIFNEENFAIYGSYSMSSLSKFSYSYS